MSLTADDFGGVWSLSSLRLSPNVRFQEQRLRIQYFPHHHPTHLASCVEGWRVQRPIHSSITRSNFNLPSTWPSRNKKPRKVIEHTPPRNIALPTSKRSVRILIRNGDFKRIRTERRPRAGFLDFELGFMAVDGCFMRSLVLPARFSF